MSKLGIISWDWREQPDLAVLAHAVYDVSGGLVHITEVDTGDDQYAIVVSDRPLGALEAVDLYRGREATDAPALAAARAHVAEAPRDELGRWIP